MAKRATFILDFGKGEDDKALVAMIDQYIHLLGWTRKRLYLMGAAKIISENNDNPELVIEIVNYMERKR